ncbi:MAG: ABC transporter permease subunit [Thermodesulfovibrionales bacterium]|nr:ABC transporter permease subunit [Thermodesulfovibrionales bacterium]
MFKLPFHIDIPDIKPRFNVIDIVVFVFIATILYIIIFIASGWRAEMQPAVEIDLSVSSLPLYSINSIFRIFAAYILSFVFALWYGYTAHKSKLHEKIMIPLLDILQSIPVLSFLPGVVLAMIALFPNSRVGVELASILLIFTGQVWNMAFSYYNSLNTLPRELRHVASVYGLSRYQRFIKIELPFSAIGLVWNSMMSISGGWFFLMACEMFVLKARDFRLPGLGSFIQTAANQGDIKLVLLGLGTMVFIIILFDIFLWRPLIAWSQKFRFDTVATEDEPESFVLNLLRKSTLQKWIIDGASRLNRRIERYFRKREEKETYSPLRRLINFFVTGSILALFAWASIRAIGSLVSLSLNEYLMILKASFFSMLRTGAAILLALVWTVPLGVLIGLNREVAKFLAPVIQILAAIPATAVFPVIILFLIRLGGGLDIGAIFLMLLGTQWYILFNVIAGASAIPADLREAARVYGIKGLMKWKVLIIPGIFPYLVTGLITATGGAWNSTIVAEHVTFGGKTLTTTGLGNLISEATIEGNYRLLLASTLTMAIIVVSINRLLWKRMFQIARERYRLE